MRLLVCGDRDWDDEWIVRTVVWGAAVSGHDDPVDVLIEGEARGADSLAREAAKAYDEINVDPYPADWTEYGKAAGPIRNRQMLKEGRPDVVVAFHDDLVMSKGTRDMCEVAAANGIPVYVVSRYRDGRML